MTAHTPGPWVAVSAFLENQPNRWIVKGKAWGAPSIADCGHDGEVNARLIAAAPLMLEALEVIAFRGLTQGQKDRGETYETIARSALAAALEGGAK